MDNPSMIMDGILLLVLLVSAVRAYNDGFFTAVIRLCGTLGSLFAGFYVADNYAAVIFKDYLRDSFIQRSFNYLQQTSRNIDIKTAISSVIGNWPQDFLDTVLHKAEELLAQVINPDMESAVYLVDEFIAPVVVAVISALLFIVCFTAVKVICGMLAKMFRSVNKVPVLGFANRLAGFVAGIAIGGVNIILLSFLFSIIVIITGDSLSFLNAEIISRSRILAMTGVVNPFLP